MAKMQANVRESKGPRKSRFVRTREATVILQSATDEVHKAILVERITNALVTGDTRGTQIVQVSLGANLIGERLFSLEVFYFMKRTVEKHGGEVVKNPFVEHIVGNEVLLETVMVVREMKKLDVDYMRLVLSAARKGIKQTPEARKIKRALKIARTG